MERFRGRKKLKNEGNQLSGKENNLPKLLPFSSSDLSYSGFSRALEGNQGVYEVGRSSSKRQSVGTTMKKLLADEMLSKEMDSGRRSPSVIANLMGLDWLPVQQNGNKQHKRASETREVKPRSDEVGRSGRTYDHRSHKKLGKGKQKGKDLHDAAERSSTDAGSNTSRAASFRSPSEDEVAFVRQKFMDVKRFSTDEKFQNSKEFHDALDVLDSNKDLLLKFLQEPDSLFAKHLNHLHGAHESRCAVRGVKSSHTLKRNVDVIGCHAGEEVSKKIDISHSHKHSDKCQCNKYNKQSIDPHKLNFSVEKRAAAAYIPTRIVVLKPNLGKARSTARSVSSTTPSRDLAYDCELQKESPSLMHLGLETVGKRIKHDNLDIFVTKSRESRELAREVARRMRNKVGLDLSTVSSSGYKGYSADESLCNISENDSSYESEAMILGSTASWNRDISNRSPASRSMESSINKEAKKRLSRRWKMTHRSQDIGSSGKGSTLAEMLATPDVDIRPRNPGTAAEHYECLHRFRRDGEATELISPLGISSRDGWKDGCIRNLSRSKSLPSSPSYLGNPKSSTRHEAITAEKFLVRKRSSGHGSSNRPSKRDSERKCRSFSESIRASNNESQSTFVEMINDIQDGLPDVNMTETTMDVKDSPDVKSVILEMPSCRSDTSLPLKTLAGMGDNSTCASGNYHDEVVPAPAIQKSVLLHDDCLNCDMSSIQQEPSKNYDAGNSCCLQSVAALPEFPLSSKECEQPSPVSVLEAPFMEELSSGSDCFERVSEGLHGLRMQLQLLKQESDVYDEGLILVSSDEDREESFELDDGKVFHCTGESWESSYLVDVLTDSGIRETEGNKFFATWHSPDCPIGPWVFECLEKKYERKSCLISERRLLFDRINAGIVQIYSEYVDTDHWLKPIIRNVSVQLSEDVLKMKLHSLLRFQEKVTEDVMDTAILDAMQWLKPGDHISGVGSDIERLLTDELIAEVLSL